MLLNQRRSCILRVYGRNKQLFGNKKLYSNDPVFDQASKAISTTNLDDPLTPVSKKKAKQQQGKTQCEQIQISQKERPSYITANEKCIPQLKHNLDKVLFNQGVHFVQDLRSGIYNFDPYCQQVTQPDEFDFGMLAEFQPPSKDVTLSALAADRKIKFVGSTSSCSSALSQIYFAMSRFRDVSLRTLDADFADSNARYTELTRLPTSVILRPSTQQPGVYSIDYCKNGVDQEETIMMHQGKILENFFTMDQSQFAKYLKCNSSDQDGNVEALNDAYAYCLYKNLLLRSQIDCMHPDLPYKTFDIKTRATAAIRLNANNYADFIPYHIYKLHGKYNSFAREYYDMMRSAMLKYSFQVRIGNMDGLFISYHNTQQVFGFQYVSRDEMDDVMFGGSKQGDAVFTFCMGVLDAVLQRMVAARSAEDGANMNDIRLTFKAAQQGKLTVYSELIGSKDANNKHGDVHKFVFTLNPQLVSRDDGSLTSLKTFEQIGKGRSVLCYSVHEFNGNDHREEYDQVTDRVYKRLTRERSPFFVDMMKREFAPYMKAPKQKVNEATMSQTKTILP